MTVRVTNGTPMHGPSLCETCSHAHIVKGYRVSEEVVVCQATYPGRRVPFRVHKCTSHVDTIRQTLKQMYDIAWQLAPKGSRQAGFVPPSRLREDEVELTLD